MDIIDCGNFQIFIFIEGIVETADIGMLDK